MKKFCSSYFANHRDWEKILLRMKLSISLLLLTFLHVSATVHSQDKLTLTAKNINWEKLFDLLEKKSNYTFLYKDNVLPRKDRIDVEAADLTVPQILDNVFRNTKLSYQVLSSRLVVITPRSDRSGPVNEIRVSGKVVSSSGDPLFGATIRVKGSTLGTNTDSSGNFTLSVPEEATLVISYVGYQSQELPVAGNTRMNITLQALPGNINEVVVIGYGTSRKRDLTGAVSTINTKDIQGLPVGGIDQIMQGKSAGVVVTQATGAPGDPISVRIRGLGTINNNDPLYIVDGIPTTAAGINEISPNDIDNISTLKDAASASIYGARAANGVVVITTRKGKSGKPKLSLNGYTGWQSPERYIKMANTSQYVNAFNTAAFNDSLTNPGSPRHPITSAMRDTLPDVDWQRATLKTAPMTNLNFSVSGGSENTQYIVSATYLTQKGMIQNSSFDRFNIRTAINSKVSSLFTFGTNINLAYNKTRQVGSSGDGFGTGNPGPSVLRYALFRTPAIPIFDKNGQYSDIPQNSFYQVNDGAAYLGDGLNPVALAANTDRNFYNYSVLGNAYAELHPIKNLTIRSDIGTNLILTDYKQFFPTWGSPARLQNSPNSLAQSSANNFSYNWTNTATYKLEAGKHSLNILVGSEAIYNDSKALSASGKTFVDQSGPFQYLDNATGQPPPPAGSNESHWTLFSLFGRLNYQYNDKYLASFNFRRDGSSRLDQHDRYGNFFSGSVGWRLDKEVFMQDIKPISMLKVRASLGQLGNQEIGNYAYTSTIGTGGFYNFGGAATPTYTIVSKGNPNVKWETSTQADAGVDIGFFNNALLVTVDYYNKKTSNMLLSIPQPSSAVSAGSPTENAGNVVNRGFEFEASYRHTINKDWRFEIGGNLATVHNEVTSLADGKPISAARIDNNVFATITTVGQPIGEFYLLKQDGIFQNSLDVITHATQGSGIQAGDVKFKDTNHDGVIDQNDRIYAGSPIPKFTYGFTGTLAYKSLDLSLFFQGVSGNKIYNQVLTDIEGFYRPFNITERIATESWHGEGTSNSFPRLSWSGAQNNKQASTRFLEDGAYLRLKNLQLGYTVGSQALSRIRIASIRIYGSVQNVFTVTKYTGLDPEMTTSANGAGDGVKAVGIDWGTYPSARTITIGANLNF
jgi:TonB-linked SusC/RagA family outer membrane protein